MPDSSSRRISPIAEGLDAIYIAPPQRRLGFATCCTCLHACLWLHCSDVNFNMSLDVPFADLLTLVSTALSSTFTLRWDRWQAPVSDPFSKPKRREKSTLQSAPTVPPDASADLASPGRLLDEATPKARMRSPHWYQKCGICHRKPGGSYTRGSVRLQSSYFGVADTSAESPFL